MPSPSSWEGIPSEILGLVLLRLPSLADRLRLRAVCRPWRAGARGQPLPPPLPWLALRDGTLFDLDGNPIRCAPILPEGVFRYFAVDNLAFVVSNDGDCSLMDPLSGATVPLPSVAPAVRRALDECKEIYVGTIRTEHKMVALSSSPLNSAQDPLIAVMLLVGSNVVISACKQPDANAIGISLPHDCTPGYKYVCATEIAFLHGNLYALTEHEGLLVLELDAGRLGERKLSSGFDRCIADNPDQKIFYNHGTQSSGRNYLVLRYLVESDGRLLMIRRWISFPRNELLVGEDRTCSFEVLQADLTTSPCQWTKVDSLHGQAIFLGTDSSKSIRASQCAGGTREDCIYFIRRVCRFTYPLRAPCADPVRDCGVYSISDGRMTPLLPEAAMAKLRRKPECLTWFFPSDV